ncbi:MAG: MFS transporter [Dehalococcoidales bacterium]|nr:MFS transporter [Dehalococcoidales bacterium]
MISTSGEETLNRFHWKIQALGGLPLLLLAVDFSVVTFALAQLVGVWNLSPFQTSTIAVAAAVGSLFGGVFFGNIADRIGRRLTIQITLLTMTVGTGLGAISWDFISLSAFQFIVGLGMGGTTPIASTFVGEFAPAKYRGMLSSGVDVFWTAGLLLAAIVSSQILPGFGWRMAFVFGAVPGLLILVQRRLMPESPRCLIAQGKHEEAQRFLLQVKEKYGLNYDHLATQPTHKNRGLLASLRELWSGPLIRRTACTCLLWFVMVYTYNGIFVFLPTLLTAGGLGISDTMQYMFILLVPQLPAALGASLLVDVIGRKRLLVPVMLICGVASYMFSGATSSATVLFWGCLISASLGAGYAIMLCYTSELFPTRLRGTGAGSASAFGRVGAIVVPGAIAFLVGSWSAGHESVFLMFAAVMLVGALGVAILGEETMGRTLEQISS